MRSIKYIPVTKCVSYKEMDRLLSVLNNKEYYSLEINYTSQVTGIPLHCLLHLNGHHISPTDWINIFQYNNVTYIGLESRRLDYERDKLAGTNWVEDAIKRGVYG